MRNKKGFTLIELLAVIVILAVIALIATPIIMNVINDAKKGAAKDSTYGYVKAVELASTQYIVKNKQSLSGTYTTKDGNLYNGSTKVLDVTVSGTKPADNGSVTLNKGFVTKVELTIGGFKVKYNGDRVTIGDEDSTNPTPKPTEEPENKKYANGTAIYFNPETNSKCSDYKDSNSLNENKSGCMKWYTFNDTEDSNTVNMILDHNTTYSVQWANKPDSIPTNLLEKLKEDTTTWNDSLNPRLIEASEIIKITGNSNFDLNTESGMDAFYYFETNSNANLNPAPAPGKAKYAWLFDYTSYGPTNLCTNYGCNIGDSNVNGYWTSTYCVPCGSGDQGWKVAGNGSLSLDALLYSPPLAPGVRPVITVNKSLIN